MVAITILTYCATVLVSLVMGVLWGTWISLSRSMHTFKPGIFLTIGKTMIHNLAKPMRIIMPLTTVSLVALSSSLLWQAKIVAGSFALAALFLMIGVMLVTLAVNVPIDRKISDWQVNTLPQNWQEIRDHWHRFHVVRTILAMLSFLCLLVVVVAVK